MFFSNPDLGRCPIQNSQKFHKLLSALLILSGILYSTFLVLENRNHVFYSDGGLKYLMVKQYSTGDFSLSLHLSKPDWVDRIWQEGYHPFSKPFVYNSGDEHYVAFPFSFQIISTPFYMLFGFWGLYLIPLVSLWFIWIRFFFLCNHFSLKIVITNLSLVTLIFASPLLIYGSIFWEHTLSILLTFYGFEFIVKSLGRSRNNPRGNLSSSIIAGTLFGLSVWLRPEAFIMLFLLLFAAFLYSLKTDDRLLLVFVKSAVIVTTSFFILNWILTGHIFGIHGIQIIENRHSISDRAMMYFKIFKDLHIELIEKIPQSILFVLGSFFFLTSKDQKHYFHITILILCFCIISPALLPNAGGKQWGPRYFLLMLPIISFLTACQLDLFFKHKSRCAKWVFTGFLLLATCFGIFKNSYQGVEILLFDRKQSRGIKDYIKKSKAQHIITNTTFLSIGMAELQQDKTFFSTEENNDLHHLLSRLKDNGVIHYL